MSSLKTHNRINGNTSKTLESTSFLYALIELLVEKKLFTIEELDERKRRLQKGLLNSIFVASLKYRGIDGYDLKARVTLFSHFVRVWAT